MNIIIYYLNNLVIKIYTWGGKFADRNLTVNDLLKAKGKQKLIQTTATNSEEAMVLLLLYFQNTKYQYQRS